MKTLRTLLSFLGYVLAEPPRRVVRECHHCGGLYIEPLGPVVCPNCHYEM